MDPTKGRYMIEGPTNRWPFWKRFLVVAACFAVLGFATSFAMAIADGAVWLTELWGTL